MDASGFLFMEISFVKSAREVDRTGDESNALGLIVNNSNVPKPSELPT